MKNELTLLRIYDIITKVKPRKQKIKGDIIDEV